MDFTKLKEEIKEGKYLPNQNITLPELPENANEEAVRINEQYKQQIEQLKLRINTLKAQAERVGAQKKLDIQWQAETAEREKELEKFNEIINNDENLIASLNAQIKSKDSTIDMLNGEIEKAKELAAMNVKGQKKELTERISQLEAELAESKNANQVEWDILFNTAIENYNIEDISKISQFLMQVIANAKPMAELANSLFIRATNLSREVEEKKQQQTKTQPTIAVQEMVLNKHVDNQVNGVANGATGIAVNESK